MIKGSHNTMTYLRDRRWWMRPFDAWSRCQSKTLEEQWESGARYFDFRVRYSNGRWTLCHGLSEYNIDIFTAINKLCEVSNNDDVYVRVMLELSKQDSEKENQFYLLTREILKMSTGFHFYFDVKYKCTVPNFGLKFVEISKQHDIKWHAAFPPKCWIWEQERIQRALWQAGFNGILTRDFV